ncbi:MAG: glycosyltransferase family 2 protein [Candidatus Pacebacteria bacterium CG10_big_fil_rev_8_21_14_0_10_56_10]|nr:MAG: glycosyltransferase family 2 protein [Candidatus Pacebacteria bacterium CG10_big_fil_rev_8_21_14_0_10_56_10]
MSEAPKLTIVVTNYNGRYWLGNTLSSLREHLIGSSGHRIRVVVVDNGSNDGSTELVKESFGWARLVALPDNQGFAAGNNRALQDLDTPYVMLLNSDVESTADTDIDTLLRYLDRHPQVAVVTPRLVFPTGQLDPACHRGEPTPWASLTYFLGLERLFPHSKLWGRYHQWYRDLSAVHQVDACSGAAMLVRAAAISKVGLLDERFFMYAEDLDWCRRFRQAGYQVVYHPEVTMVHHKYKSGLDSSSGRVAAKTQEYFYDTMLQYYDKHYRHRYPSWLRVAVRVMLLAKRGVSS